MYKVYAFISDDWHLVDLCFQESQVIDTLIEFNNKYHTFNFDIWEVLDNTPYHYRRIACQDEFNELMLEYNTTRDIPDLSAVELKRLILERVKL